MSKPEAETPKRDGRIPALGPETFMRWLVLQLRVSHRCLSQGGSWDRYFRAGQERMTSCAKSWRPLPTNSVLQPRDPVENDGERPIAVNWLGENELITVLGDAIYDRAYVHWERNLK